MAKTSFVQIPAGDEIKFHNALASGDRFNFPRIKRKVLFSSRKRRAGLTAKSVLPAVSSAWNNLTLSEQEAWATAALVNDFSGYRLFTQDTSFRLKTEMSGLATPSIYHQYKVGKIQIDNPDDAVTILQTHPYSFWVSKKIRGVDQREPVKLIETMSLPLKIGISWKSDLSIVSGSSFTARFYAKVYSLYQGRTIENILEIPFGLSDDWQSAEATLSSVVGIVKSYDLYIELDNVVGSLLFDNVVSYHTGQNWARDPFCNNIAQTFTRVYYQVPKHWAPVVLESASFYGSIYPED